MKYINGELKNVYKITGEDGYLISQAIAEIESQLDDAMPEMNKSVFNDENFSADKVIYAASQLPFMAKKRLVVVREVSKISEDDKKKLIAYAKNPSPESVLVFVDDNKIFSAIPATPIDCKNLSPYELTALINSEVQKRGKRIEPDAVKFLIENCSGVVLKIENELEKLYSYLGDGELITLDMAKKLVTKSEDYNVFELSEALSKKNGEKAISLATLMLEDGDPGMIFSLLSNHFRRLFHSKISKETPAELAKLFGVKEYAIIKARQQAENFSAGALKKINELILSVDYMVKNGEMNAVNGVYFLIFSILRDVK